MLVKGVKNFFVQPVTNFYLLVLAASNHKLLLCLMVVLYKDLHDRLEVNLGHFGYKGAVIQ